MKTTLLASAGLALLVCALGACSVETRSGASGSKHDGWFDGGFDDALKQARASNQLVFMDFWTTWCGWCKKLDKESFPDPAVRAELGKMVALSIDAESPEGVPVAKRYRATGYPTMVVVDGDGREVGRIVGYLEAGALARKLQEIRARAKR